MHYDINWACTCVAFIYVLGIPVVVLFVGGGVFKLITFRCVNTCTLQFFIDCTYLKVIMLSYLYMHL